MHSGTSTVLLLAAALAACSSQQTTATPVLNGGQQASPAVETPLVAAGAPATPSVASATPPGGATAAASSPPADVTQEAAGRFVPTPSPSAPAAPAVTPGVNYSDAQAVAKGYVGSRMTYRFDVPAGYTAALTAPAFTTPAFAARSTPTAAALGRLAASQETSAVVVSGAELAVEALNTASTRYVVVTCTVTTTYRGGGDTTPAAWTLRLLQVAPGQWRIDGVLSTD